MVSACHVKSEVEHDSGPSVNQCQLVGSGSDPSLSLQLPYGTLMNYDNNLEEQAREIWVQNRNAIWETISDLTLLAFFKCKSSIWVAFSNYICASDLDFSYLSNVLIAAILLFLRVIVTVHYRNIFFPEMHMALTLSAFWNADKKWIFPQVLGTGC